MGEAVERVAHDAADFAFLDVGRLHVEFHGLLHGPHEAAGVVGVEDEAVAGGVVPIEREDGVVKAACVVRDGERAVDRRLHLRETARLEERRHESEVRRGETELREASVEIRDGEAVGNAVERLDIPERLLVGAVGDDGELRALVVILVEEAIRDVREELRTLLDGIEAAGPEEERRVGVFFEAEGVLERELVLALHFAMVLGAVLERDLVVRGRVVGRIGGVQNAGGAACVELAAHFVADRIRHERMPAVHDLLQERGRDGVDEVRGEHAGRLEVDLVVVAALFVGIRRIGIVQVHPELRRIDARVLDLRESEFLRMDVMDGKQRRDALAAAGGGDEARHPVVAVDEVRLDVGDDVVYDFALESERKLDVAVAARIHCVAIVEAAVLGEVDVLVREVALVFAQFRRDELGGLDVEHAAVVRQRDVDIRAEFVERLHERCGYIRHAARLRGHLAGEVAHAFGQIRNLRRDNQNARFIFRHASLLRKRIG